MFLETGSDIEAGPSQRCLGAGKPCDEKIWPCGQENGCIRGVIWMPKREIPV